jgi:hypothetical protein
VARALIVIGKSIAVVPDRVDAAFKRDPTLLGLR